MELQKILSLIPAKLLEELAVETEVNVFSKKLQGEVIFKLLLHCIISDRDNSLRGMESTYETLFFSLINRKHHQTSVRYSSISKRLSTINAEYFEKIFDSCVSLYKKELGSEKEAIIRFDSTIVALSAKLLNIGYNLKGGNAENVRQLKFTIGYANEIAEKVFFSHSQNHTSENVALKEAIVIQSAKDKDSIKVFDRGITSRNTYDFFTDNDIQFISRVSAGSKYKTVRLKERQTPLPVEADTVRIISDDWCYFYGNKGKQSTHLYRRIEVQRIKDNETIIFITNNQELEAEEIADLYKRRWDIEVFFKFIKQLLNFSHLVNRSENGIKVVLYVTMIAAILLAAYKKANNLTGFKIPKLKFANELEMGIVRELISMCGGDPEKLNDFLLCNTS